MRNEVLEEVKKIKNKWSNERNDNEKKEEEFERLKNNWIKIQEKLRVSS